MVTKNDQLATALRAHSLSITKPRRVVFAALQDNEPQTMADLIKACAGQVDRASLYRTIDLFERLGIVQRLQIGWKYRLELSNAFQEHHHHLTCTNCGQIIPLHEDPELEDRLHVIAQQHHFRADDHQLEVSGLCEQCQKVVGS